MEVFGDGGIMSIARYQKDKQKQSDEVTLLLLVFDVFRYFAVLSKLSGQLIVNVVAVFRFNQ